MPQRLATAAAVLRSARQLEYPLRLEREAIMRTTTAAPECAAPREQLHRLGVLLDEALAECHSLHHRIREMQLHLAELSASADAGRPVAAVRGNAPFIG